MASSLTMLFGTLLTGLSHTYTMPKAYIYMEYLNLQATEIS